MISPLLLLLSGSNESAALLHLATDLRVERTRLASIQSIACLIPRPSSCRSAAGAPLQRATTVTNCFFFLFVATTLERNLGSFYVSPSN